MRPPALPIVTVAGVALRADDCAAMAMVVGQTGPRQSPAANAQTALAATFAAASARIRLAAPAPPTATMSSAPASRRRLKYAAVRMRPIASAAQYPHESSAAPNT